MKKLIVLAGLLVLAGCGPSQRLADEGAAACREQFPMTAGNYAKRAECTNAAVTNAGFRSATQGLLNATRLQLAEKVDRGEITAADAAAQFARLRYDLAQQEDEARFQRAAAAAAILGAMPRPEPYVAPAPYQMPTQQPWSATCMRTGIMTTCNGN